MDSYQEMKIVSNVSTIIHPYVKQALTHVHIMIEQLKVWKK